MKIAFITHDRMTPSTRYRVTQFIPYLKAEGFVVDTIRLSQNPIARYLTILKLKQYDYVCIQKKLFSRFWFSLIRGYSRSLVYEFDDCVYLTKKGGSYHLNGSRWKRFQNQIGRADLVIASSPHLQSQAQKHTCDKWKIKIIPNCVNPAEYPVKAHTDSEQVIIGWIGSASTVGSLHNVKDQLAQLADAYPNVKFKVVSDKPFDFPLKNLENKMFKLDEEIPDILSFDISISTYFDDPWNMGKAPTKILTSMACGIPVVAINSVSARVYIKHHYNGMLSVDAPDMLAQLCMLIESPKLRQILGTNARSTVESYFNITKVVKGYKSILIKN